MRRIAARRLRGLSDTDSVVGVGDGIGIEGNGMSLGLANDSS
jgi:hypothetical protein